MRGANTNEVPSSPDADSMVSDIGSTTPRSGADLLASNSSKKAKRQRQLAELTKSHVQLCKKPISWRISSITPIKVNEEPPEGSNAPGITHQVFYDTLHEELIMLSRAPNGAANVSISDHKSSNAGRDYLALQVNIREVKVVDIARGRLVAARSCRSHKSRITNIYWCKWGGTIEQLFLFVTNTGAELYVLKPKPQDSTLKHLKTVQHQTRYHWFVNSSNWLLVVDLKHIFSLYNVTPKGLVRKCKFELNCRGTNYNKNDAYYEQISLVELYGEVMCVFINEQKVGKVAAVGKLYILGLQKDTMVQKYMYDLYTPSKYEISVIDNVLVVHNMLAKLAILFDVRTDPVASLAAPLPMAYEQYEESKDDEKHVIVVIAKEAMEGVRARQQHVQVGEYEFLVDDEPRSQGSLNAVCYEWQVYNAKRRKLGSDTKRDGSVTSSSSSLNSSSTNALDTWRGYQIVSQDDILHFVFEEALRAGMTRASIVPYVLEYVRNVTKNFLKLSERMNMFLVELLLKDKRYFELHQFLQYHILLDSKVFAQKLLELQEEYQPAYQLSLDMWYRLGAFPEMMRVLVSKRQVMQALQLVTHHSAVFREEGLKPRDFLRAALDMGRSGTFFTAFRFFQARNQALRGSASFLPEDECEEFVRVFERNFRRTAETSLELKLDAPTPTATSAVSSPAKEEAAAPSVMPTEHHSPTLKAPPIKGEAAAATTAAVGGNSGGDQEYQQDSDAKELAYHDELEAAGEQKGLGQEGDDVHQEEQLIVAATEEEEEKEKEKEHEGEEETGNEVVSVDGEGKDSI
eukprot:jgi/Bigna1/91710/estExt_fgenesh1_pg.C_1140030